MTIRPIKKIKLPQESVESSVVDDPFSKLSTVPELLGMAYIQEVEARYISVIETIILRINSDLSEKVWVYGPRKITSHIISVISNVTGKPLEILNKKSACEKDSLYFLDMSSSTMKSGRSILYRILEKGAPSGSKKTKFIFQIPRVSDMMKLDKRIVSRMDGVKAYVKELREKEYLKIFSTVIEILKARVEEYAKKGVQFNFQRIEEKLEEFVHFAYLMDNTYEGMSLRFFKFIYEVEEAKPYALLNSIHLIILLSATVKRVTLCSVYDEFERRVANQAHLKRTRKDTVFRRLTDLMSTGLIARGYFTSDRQELEAEVLSRNEVSLKVMLDRVKSHWGRLSC
ncbi:uncharacterized protein NEMAJ01_1479 [Nematocida major]|uniref:uncharacterized protein n=1 Tax=Nematocida major TaxID=1912982 RepID=UPI0020085990|nr:uncharacterized protein NEMAJ01_1479 [Nematocida major]KAH9386583.1 hypothetical protein NEMAJ01_1479 [Nematocida major]